MRFIIVHKTTAEWEAGAIPDRQLIAGVGELIGDMARAGILRAGEGLRASSLGARLTISGGAADVVPGPFAGSNELPAGFEIIRAATLDDAVAWAREVGKVLGDAQLDVRPVTEPWDIGMGSKPDDVRSLRFMVLRKATAATEAGTKLTAHQRARAGRAAPARAGGPPDRRERHTQQARAPLQEQLGRRGLHRRPLHRIEGAGRRLRDRRRRVAGRSVALVRALRDRRGHRGGGRAGVGGGGGGLGEPAPATVTTRSDGGGRAEGFAHSVVGRERRGGSWGWGVPLAGAWRSAPACPQAGCQRREEWPPCRR